MKKAMVTIASGERFQRLERCTGPFRRAYADRNGWDYIVDATPFPSLSRGGQRLAGLSTSSAFRHDETFRSALLHKLKLPRQLQDYDLVAFVDCDGIINPSAPCLSQYYDSIPKGGFAAGQTISFDDRRKVYPRWNRDYYMDIEALGVPLPELPDRRVHINAGLLLYKPREVVERWAELAELDSPMIEEHRLNVYEVQRGQCLILPTKWHVLWRYFRDKRYRSLRLVDIGSRVNRKLTGKTFSTPWERRRFLEALQSNHFLHLAFEHDKAYYFLRNASPDSLLTITHGVS